MAIKEFDEILNQMSLIHKSKNADYSTEVNPFSNFDLAAALVSQFEAPMDQVFAGIIGIKLGRLSALLKSDKMPNHESIEDTFIDLANYCVLWASWYKKLNDTRGPVIT